MSHFFVLSENLTLLLSDYWTKLVLYIYIHVEYLLGKLITMLNLDKKNKRKKGKT